MKLSRNQFITVNALLCAIVLLFVIVPTLGLAKTAFIPLVAIIVSAEFIGLKNGIFTGLFFGIVSLVTSFIAPSVLYFAFNNPLISVLPRIFIGISAYYTVMGIRKMLPKLPKFFSYAAGTVAGVLTNTIGVLGMIMVFYYGESVGTGGTAINWEFISTIVISNSLLELLICTVVTPPIVIALKKAFRLND